MQIRFLEKMTASILSNNRLVAPFGMAGGEPGKPGRNYAIRADGTREDLAFVASTEMQPGDVFVIETPGGGYGAQTGNRDGDGVR
jgi:5-oxoprolinase (ATP-hydrolysing)